MEKNIDFDAVADLYDYYVNTDMDIKFYIELCKGRKNILELMCGTGRVSMYLINEGYNLTCVDYCQRMLDIFKSKLYESQKARIICQDVCELDIKDEFDLIIIPFNSFSEITDYKKREQTLKRIYSHLSDNGVFFVSLYNPRYRIKTAYVKKHNIGKFQMTDGKMLCVSYKNKYNIKENTIKGMQYYDIYDKYNILREKRKINIKFSLISEEEITAAAKNAGFSVQSVYGDYEKNYFREESSYMNFVFKKA